MTAFWLTVAVLSALAAGFVWLAERDPHSTTMPRRPLDPCSVCGIPVDICDGPGTVDACCDDCEVWFTHPESDR